MISLKFFFSCSATAFPKKEKVKEGKSYLSLKGHLERTNFGFMAMGGGVARVLGLITNSTLIPS